MTAEDQIMASSNPAETYESYMVPTLFGPWAACLIQQADPRPSEHVLDVACGTGVVARQVAPVVGAAGRVIAVDISPNMLAVARSVAAREQRAIDWHEGRAEELPFPNGTFDLVLCQFALMFFEDRHRALTEMRRVLRASGRVALSVWQGLDRHPFYRLLDDAIQRRLGMSGVATIFALGDAAELRALLTDAGFRDIEIEPISMTARFPHPEAFLAGEIDVDTAAVPSMQHLDSRGRQAVTAAIRVDMTDPLREATVGDHVVLPFHAHIVRARC
jgi:ubiquinone/menaquinone biosynthesis C-methylase UbiE